VGIASQVFEDRVGPAEGRLGVDHPLRTSGLGEESVEGWAMSQGLKRSMEAEPFVLEGLVEEGQELAPKEAAQDPHGKKEVRGGGYPSRPIGGQAAGGHHAVDVGMEREFLAPGVEDSEEPDLGPEVTGVGSHLEQGPRCSLKEESIDHPRVLKGQRGQKLRQGEDHVEVWDGQQMRLLGIEPLGRLTTLALGAMPVAAGVV
jgi:hypothetical protein